MHRLASAFILGYHGCDQRVGERLLSGAPFQPSSKDYDWLGPGIYFWEANPLRGLEFAAESSKRKTATVSQPFVIGAVIELGLCLDRAYSFLYHAGMKRQAREIQYTIRGIPQEVDRTLRRKAAQRKLSLNQIVIEELTAVTTGYGSGRISTILPVSGRPTRPSMRSSRVNGGLTRISGSEARARHKPNNRSVPR